MKRLLFAAFALLVALPAHAFNPIPGSVSRVVPIRTLPLTNTQPYARRVLVLQDGRDDALNQANVKAEAAVLAKAIGPTFSGWAEMGAQVDFLRTDFFELPADSLADGTHLQRVGYLWQHLGDYYPTVVCVGFNTDGANTRKRYFSADSTNAKIIHFGGYSGASSWLEATATFGTCDTSGAGSFFDQRRGTVTAYNNPNADSLWFGNSAYGIRPGLLLSGITSVVRLFDPVKLAKRTDYPAVDNTYFGWGPDTTSFETVQPAAGDSVAKPWEIMPVAWRVYWTGTASVDFIKFPFGADYDFGAGHVLTALVSRTTKLNAMPAAMELDDVFDANPTTATRPTNAAWDSVMREFRQTWGVPLAIATNPRHASEYYAASNPTRESAWNSGAGWTWMRSARMPWIHHAHDSTSTDIASGLLGRFGGYSTANGSTSVGWTGPPTGNDSITTWGFTRYLYSHRGGQGTLGSGDVRGDKYTIQYRLQWADSIRRVTCPECITPPYLSFQNNELLPTDWRARPASVSAATTAGFWTRWKSYQGDGKCTIDSTLLAFHAGLKIPSGGELFVRGSNISNSGVGAAFNYAGHMATGYAVTGDDAPKNWTVSGDNDSVVAKTPFSYPDERVSSWIAGRLVKVRSVGAMRYDNAARSNYTKDVSRALSALLGCRTGTLTSAGFSTWSDAWSADPGGVINGVTTDQKNFGTAHVRMVYMHPNGSWTNATGPSGNYAIQCARLGLLGGLRTLESVASHKLIRWVYPWEVYAK